MLLHGYTITAMYGVSKLDFSIVIPHRGPALGLWSTICSCDQQLSGSAYSYEYVIVTNGEPVDEEVQLTFRYLKERLVHIHSDAVLTPPVARARGVEASSGALLFFFDNHCIAGPRYFDRALADIERYKMSMLHSATKFFAGDIEHFHYRLHLETNMWGSSATFPLNNALPYRIAASGHGGFIVTRDAWDALGGYGPDDLFVGYAGEEFTFDLKAARMGMDNWLDPKLMHYHWAGNRPYRRHYTDDFYRNLLTSALVLGGEKWLYKVYGSFVDGMHIRLNPTEHMFDLMQTSYQRGFSYAKELDSNCKYSLDEVLAKFRVDGVAH